MCPRVVYDLLMRSAAETVSAMVADPKLLGAQTTRCKSWFVFLSNSSQQFKPGT